MAAAVLLLLTAAATPTYRYQIDAPRSSVDAKVAFMGLASKSARFPQMSGGIHLTPDRLDTIDLDVTLNARALTAGDKTTLERLRGKDFFDVERYPAIRFSGNRMMMTGQSTARVDGQITARGITRPATLAVTFAQPPVGATGKEPIQLSARTTINRHDFGMTAYSVVVGRKVTITINARMVPG
ncbi:YceI family protein [Novosphingobium sp.]|uniref:YceI family protein n=1 Tax=Novosphingobium sp. TaxID=1874826 RepID=UPI0027363A48|nr:YceI family protein [Novosphingobium sp.]MDP3907992.1 YceI family protein [Novosphingobium sp.]